MEFPPVLCGRLWQNVLGKFSEKSPVYTVRARFHEGDTGWFFIRKGLRLDCESGSSGHAAGKGLAEPLSWSFCISTHGTPSSSLLRVLLSPSTLPGDRFVNTHVWLILLLFRICQWPFTTHPGHLMSWNFIQVLHSLTPTQSTQQSPKITHYALTVAWTHGLSTEARISIGNLTGDKSGSLEMPHTHIHMHLFFLIVCLWSISRDSTPSSFWGTMQNLCPTFSADPFPFSQTYFYLQLRWLASHLCPVFTVSTIHNHISLCTVN